MDRWTDAPNQFTPTSGDSSRSIKARAVTQVTDGLFQFCPPLTSAIVVLGVSRRFNARRHRRMDQLAIPAAEMNNDICNIGPAKVLSVEALTALNTRITQRLDVDEIFSWIQSQKVCYSPREMLL